MEEILSFRDVEIRFGGRPVVRGVSFTLHRREILGVVGESGSGKTTLLRAAMGLLDGGAVTRGEILFRGRSVTGMTERELRRLRGGAMAMIFQDSGASFCPIRTIGDQISEAVACHRAESGADIRARALDLFAKLRFDDPVRVWNSYPFELSGGMNQRVGIAAAMLTEPALLLADEPTAALDTIARREVLREMLKLRELSDAAVILVTHDIGVLAAAADTALVLRRGEAKEYGPASRVLSAPADPYTRELLAAVPKLRRSS